MDTRITELPALRLVGYAKRVPLVHEGINPHIAEHVATISIEEVVRLKSLNDTEPSASNTISCTLWPRAFVTPTVNGFARTSILRLPTVRRTGAVISRRLMAARG